MADIRPRNIEAIKHHRDTQECSIFEAGLWDDRRRYTEAVNNAVTVEDLKQTLRVIIQEVFK